MKIKFQGMFVLALACPALAVAATERGSPPLSSPVLWSGATRQATIGHLEAGSHASSTASGTLDFQRYLAEVGNANLELLAQRYDVPIAEADIAIARRFPDPQLTFGLDGRELAATARRGTHATTMSELGWTLELGGKRKARIAAAHSAVGTARAQLDEAVRQLHAAAANAFVDALKARLVLARKQSSLEGLRKLVALNETRRRAGDISVLELARTRLEADSFAAEVDRAEATVGVADAELDRFLGGTLAGRTPAGELQRRAESIDPPGLAVRAAEHRSDVRLARRELEQAQAQVGVARAESWPDLQLGVGLKHTPPSRGWGVDDEGSPLGDVTPVSNVGYWTVQLPLPLFSRSHAPERAQARDAQAQAELRLRQAQLGARTEVLQAAVQYHAADHALSRYAEGIVRDADKVLEGMLLSYRHGNASLVELLAARQSNDEVYLQWYDAMEEQLKALIALRAASGEVPPVL